MKKLEDYITSIPDFPEKGIIFRDVTTVLQDSEGFKLAIDSYMKMLDGVDFDLIVGVEARGFIFGSVLAYLLHKPFILARKPGKLPRETVSVEYELEYGTDSVELHADSVKNGDRAVIVDDLIATGGTVEAVAKLIEKLGGSVEKIVFLIELAGLRGRDRLSAYDVDAAIVYEGK